jgi:cysteine desulfurase
MAHSSLRFGLGRFTTDEQVDFAIAQVREAVINLRALSPLWDMHIEGTRSMEGSFSKH